MRDLPTLYSRAPLSAERSSPVRGRCKRSCKVCSHPESANIEREIAAGTLTKSKAAQIVGCDKSTVSRHFSRCVAPYVAEIAQQQAREKRGINVMQQLERSLQTTQHIIENSLNEGQRRDALKALEVELKQLELMAKLTSQCHEAPQVNFLLSTEHMQLKQVIIKALEPYPEARQRAARALRGVNDESVDQ